MKRFILVLIVVLAICVLPAFATTFDSNDLYISNYVSGTVDHYNGMTGAFIETVAGAAIGGPGISPMGIAFDPNGRLWVAGFSENRIDIYSESGFVQSVATVEYPEGLTFGSDGNAYTCGRYDMVVKKYDGVTGADLGTFVDIGTTVAGATGVTSLVFGPDGNLYATVNGTMTVERFNGGTGEYMGQFATVPGTAIKYLAFGRTNKMFVASYYNNAVYRYDATIGGIPEGTYGGINHATGVCLRSDGYLYVSGWDNNSITRYDNSDTRTSDYITAVNYPGFMIYGTVPYQLPDPECGDAQHPYPIGDFTTDCLVDFNDLGMLVNNWMECTHSQCDW